MNQELRKQEFKDRINLLAKTNNLYYIASDYFPQDYREAKRMFW